MKDEDDEVKQKKRQRLRVATSVSARQWEESRTRTGIQFFSFSACRLTAQAFIALIPIVLEEFELKHRDWRLGTREIAGRQAVWF